LVIASIKAALLSEKDSFGLKVKSKTIYNSEIDSQQLRCSRVTSKGTLKLLKQSICECLHCSEML
jgi:hypothetical protein